MINDSILEQIAAAVAKSGFDKAGRSTVQQQFADIRLTYCLLDEMGPKEPFREYEGFSLFLVGSSDHCLSLTSSLEDPTGVVMAEGGAEHCYSSARR